MLDFRTLFPAAPGLMVAASLLHPAVLLGLFVALAVWQRSSHAAFLMHLLQQS